MTVLPGGSLTSGSASLLNVVDDTTPQLGGELDTNSFTVNESEGAPVASASITNIWGSDGNTVRITGTETITRFRDPTRVGAWCRLIFDDVLNILDGPNTRMPGGADFTTAPGDVAFVYGETASVCMVLLFKADGTPIVGPSIDTSFGLNGDPGSLAIGTGALDLTTTAVNNTAIGTGAGASVTVGLDSVFIGTNAGALMDDGKSIIAIGPDALSSAIDVQNSIAIGRDALKSFVGEGGPDENTAIGWFAQKSATTAKSNVSVGNAALRFNTGGGENVAFGALTSQLLQGSRNTALGNLALSAIAPGTIASIENVAVGYFAMARTTSGDSNVVVGVRGMEQLTTGRDNIGIGTDVGATVITGINNILIGSDTTFATDVSDRLNIGGMLFGDLANNRLGIGMELPLHSFHVQSLRVGTRAQVSLETFGTITGNDSAVSLRRSRSTTVDTLSAVFQGDVLGELDFFGSSPTTWQLGASIQAEATGTFSTTSAPTMLQFFTTPNGSTTPFARLTIQPQGTIQIFGDANGNQGGFASGILQIRNSKSGEFDGAFMTGHSSFGGNTQLWYFGSTSSSNHTIAMINRQNASFEIWTNNLQRVIVDGAGQTTFNNFTALGTDDAPLIKMKKLMGTSASTQGGTLDMIHGLTLSKIIGIMAVMTQGSGNKITQGFTAIAGHQFSVFADGTNMKIVNEPGDSSQILSMPVTVLITYEA
ncbi:MAG: hypothetical protein V3R83_12410 [Gammaproteobacteria bacterium]